LATVMDVARRAKVSSATVSRVLSGHSNVTPETRERVMEAVRLLGYQPNIMAQSLRLGRSRSVALLTGDIEQGTFPAMTHHMQMALEEIELDLLLFNLGHREDRLHHLFDRAVAMGLRGIVLAAPRLFNMEQFLPRVEALQRAGILIVSVGQRLDTRGIPSIVYDNALGGFKAAAYLYERGRLPAVFAGRIKDSYVGRERYRGFQKALSHFGVISPESGLWEYTDRYRSDAGYHAVARALDAGTKIRGVVAMSDELALGGMSAALDRGLRIPEDMAFVGFGALEWGEYMRPALTSVRIDSAVIATEIKNVFSAFVAGKKVKKLSLIEPELVVRQSA